jgi:hypothetical protein
MEILSKIIGMIVCAIGIGVWYIDYIVFTAIGALTAWIASAVGITGMAVLGIQVVGWILTASIMILLLFAGIVIICSGIGMILE